MSYGSKCLSFLQILSLSSLHTMFGIHLPVPLLDTHIDLALGEGTMLKLYSSHSPQFPFSITPHTMSTSLIVMFCVCLCIMFNQKSKWGQVCVWRQRHVHTCYQFLCRVEIAILINMHVILYFRSRLDHVEVYCSPSMYSMCWVVHTHKSVFKIWPQ